MALAGSTSSACAIASQLLARVRRARGSIASSALSTSSTCGAARSFSGAPRVDHAASRYRPWHGRGQLFCASLRLLAFRLGCFLCSVEVRIAEPDQLLAIGRTRR